MPTITDTSNLPAIFDAVYSIAQGVSGIAWADQFEGLWPDNAQVKKYPTLIVPYPEYAGAGAGGMLTGKEEVWGSQRLDLFWNCNVYCVSPYDHADANTWRVPMSALGLIVKTFRANRLLNATATNSKITEQCLIEWADKASPGLRFFGCQVTIQAFEQILTPDT